MVIIVLECNRCYCRILVFHGHDVNRQKALHILNTRLKARQLTLIEMVRLEDFYTFPRGFDRKLVEQGSLVML